MDVPTQIQSLIDEAKADKSIAQPWRNYGLKHLHEALADFEKGMRTSNQVPPPEAVNPPPQQAVCICPPGGKRNANCPVHGLTT